MANFPIFEDVSADVIAWGSLGGYAYSIYFLRKAIYEYQLSKHYAVYWFAYPIAGMIFGFALAAVFAAGFLSLQAKPSYAVYAGIAFVAGNVPGMGSWNLSGTWLTLFHEPKKS